MPEIRPSTAMILAAGRGERMRPLTDTTPKPLLQAGGKRLIDFHLLALAKAGYQNVVINLSHLGTQIVDALGDGHRFNLSIHYSEEGPQPLETAGGIVHALPLLDERPFAVVNADVWSDIDYGKLALPRGSKAHLVLVNNPAHHPAGDFALHDGQLKRRGDQRYTFSGIGVYDPGIFRHLPGGKAPLAPILYQLADANQLSGQLHQGEWRDIGTPERLHELQQYLSHSTP